LIIAITPSVKETYKNQLEYCIDIRLINFLKYCFINPKIFIINESSLNIKNINLLIISGGNDIYNLEKKKKNLIRNQLDKKVLNNAIKKKIPVLGICYGAQFISHYFNNKVYKKGGHVQKINKIIINDKSYVNKNFIKVKCFHNYAINNHKKFDLIGISEDKTMEFYKIKNKKIYGMMWHPERDLNYKKYNKNIIKKICS
jgi:gamma-glutamyl-gamma-aminobutyrate hydrolase PuuD